MQTLALDGRTGASGDMILGALLAAGADPDRLSVVESVLDVEYRIDETTKNGIRATTVDVLVGDDSDGESEASSGNSGHDHGDRNHGSHSHEHDDGDHGGHSHDHEQDSTHSHAHAEGAGPSRTYTECRDLVGEMGLPSGVESDALAVFRRLGEAEASVHGTDLETTHFHEVGADDAIADIVGAALLFDDLGADRVVTTPVSGGGGEVSMSHGVYPVPTPAVTYVAEAASWRLRGGPLETELLTPTGAAILAHFADGVDSLPAIDIEASGYGAGSKSFEAHANVLRATVGDASESSDEATAGGLRRDGIRVLETNLDDATPETLGGLDSQLRDAGARDVTILPAMMKKSRPGHVLKVIVKPDDVGAVARRLAAETGTLGIRETPARHRWIADRTFETVTVAFGERQYEVTVKIAADADGEVYDVSAEYDDAERVAGRADVPVREVLRRAEAAYRD